MFQTGSNKVTWSRQRKTKVKLLRGHSFSQIFLQIVRIFVLIKSLKSLRRTTWVKKFMSLGKIKYRGHHSTLRHPEIMKLSSCLKLCHPSLEKNCLTQVSCLLPVFTCEN
ncbi:hypothetical protein ACF0H5_019088 [Mactra antiquata]